LYLRNRKDTEREINPFPARAERAFVCLIFRTRRFRGLLQHMTRSYEAADKSHLEQRSDFAVTLAFQKISALSELKLPLFWSLFCSLPCIPCFRGCTSPTTPRSRTLSLASAQHQDVCCGRLEGAACVSSPSHKGCTNSHTRSSHGQV